MVLATSASRRAMWKRQVAHELEMISDARTDDNSMTFRMPNGEEIHNISKLYQKRCRKDEERKAHRFMRSSIVGSRSPVGAAVRQPLDPDFNMTQRINNVPDALYNTDCGNKKTLQRGLEDGTNPCSAAFNSTKDRFASTAAYRASTSKKRAINIKKKQTPTPAYVSKSARFADAKEQVAAVLSSSPDAHDRAFVRVLRPDKIKGPLMSPTPRFKSTVFPGETTTMPSAHPSGDRYVSSKQHQLIHDAPDRFYDISPACRIPASTSRLGADCRHVARLCAQSAVHGRIVGHELQLSVLHDAIPEQSPVFRAFVRSSACVAAGRRPVLTTWTFVRSQEAAMVHNTPNLPILVSSTINSVGPGAYNVPSPTRPSTHDEMNFIMMPQHTDRFGLTGPNVGFIEARFRRFGVEPPPPRTPASPNARSPRTIAMSKIWKSAPNKALKVIKPIVHVGFLPLIIYLAMRQEPQITLWQVIFPLASPADPPMLTE
ncbi:TPA: hypothetical protein N0F65_012944 [Lagenidium giganteum]|uniref:Mitochondrial import receptor subunit TOM7 n=1 Tax=Lagenidium giganteum TaxID=4803 RepID=A0AAV2Z0F7_9STRA|nr:TPA: hypothetical protein N0F65_012944 [Lagenidium giganteum]